MTSTTELHGFLCTTPIYRFEGWTFEVPGYGGPWPLRSDMKPRKRAGKRFFDTIARFEKLSAKEQSLYRISGGCCPFNPNQGELMSNMDAPMDKETMAMIDTQTQPQTVRSAADLVKALEKRLKLSQKLSAAISAYVAHEGYPPEVGSPEFTTTYGKLKEEQEKIQAQILEYMR